MDKRWEQPYKKTDTTRTLLNNTKYRKCRFLSHYKKSWKIQDIFRGHQSKRDRQHNGQKKKDKQWSTKHYTEN